MTGGLHEFRRSAAKRILREAGYADFAQLLDAPAPPVEPAPAEPVPHPLDQLVDDPPVHAFLLVDGRVRGADGWCRLSRGLRLLLRVLQAAGEPVGHGYTSPSCERVLRAARRQLAEIDERLADLILTPVVGDETVTVATRRPVEIVIRERL